MAWPFLYLQLAMKYDSKLAAATAIVLWEQGKGAMKNVSALREVPLVYCGIMNQTTHEI